MSNVAVNYPGIIAYSFKCAYSHLNENGKTAKQNKTSLKTNTLTHLQDAVF